MSRHVSTAPLAFDSARLPLLDAKQLGHLRHIENLALQPDGEWAKMGQLDPGQEWLSSYRYQLAHMAYALGLAHYHRLPAAPCVFRGVFDRLILKMLRREVWGYWKDTSRSGVRVNPDIKELREGWIDPVVKENIMYSGHLHAMVGMYSVLFDDDKYDAPGSLTFRHDPVFWGMGPETFAYDHDSLNDVIYWQMVENGWLGVACEPNCIFIVCNQFPILGFRFHDLRKGASIAEEATNGYRAAWENKGLLDKDGHFNFFWRMEQDELVRGQTVFADAWTGAIMNAWNRAFVRSLYAQQLGDWLKEGPEGTASLHAPSVVPVIREKRRRGESTKAIEDRSFPWSLPDFGYTAMWASEMGDEATLSGLLAHADRFMNPTWERGGLYYPRNDQCYDQDGNLTFMDPSTGNALLAYARLNAPDGLWALYNRPWDASHFQEPCLMDVSPRVDVLRAWYDRESNILALTLHGRDHQAVEAHLLIDNVPRGKRWTLYRDEVAIASGDAESVSATESLRIEWNGARLEIAGAIQGLTTFLLSWR